MLAAALLMTTALFQAAPGGPLQPLANEPVAIEGRVELSPGEADRSAVVRAEQQVRWELERRGAATLAAARPFWMPELIGQRMVADWLRRVPVDRAYEVLDAQREQHDHGSYLSYRTTLQVVTDSSVIEAMLRDLRRRVHIGTERLAWVLGGTAGLWAVLALLYGWLDRLTRGYMPWRLRLVCVGMGIAAPGIALLFV